MMKIDYRAAAYKASDFEAFSTPQILDIYNEMVADAHKAGASAPKIVQKFESKSVAVRRTLLLHAMIVTIMDEAHREKIAEEVGKVQEQIAEDDAKAEASVATPSIDMAPSPVAEVPVAEVPVAEVPVAEVPVAETKVVVPEKKAVPSNNKRTSGVKSDDAKIYILHKEGNPKREGSKQHEFWNLYKDGMLVSEFKKSIGDEKMAKYRLYWDQERKLIEVK